MKIEFRSKEESNKEQEKEFLALSPAERVQRFFRLMEQLSLFEKKKKNEENSKKDNFVIIINCE